MQSGSSLIAWKTRGGEGRRHVRPCVHHGPCLLCYFLKSLHCLCGKSQWPNFAWAVLTEQRVSIPSEQVELGQVWLRTSKEVDLSALKGVTTVRPSVAIQADMHQRLSPCPITCVQNCTFSEVDQNHSWICRWFRGPSSAA